MQKLLVKENILPVLFIIAFSIFIVLFNQTDFVFMPIHNAIWGGFNASTIMMFIFVAGNFFYVKTKDKRMLTIAAGFFVNGLFEAVHSLNSFNSGAVQFIYYIFGVVSILSAIYLNLFHAQEPIAQRPKIFAVKTYLAFLSYFILINALAISGGKGPISLFVEAVPIQSCFAALFLLATFLYLDARKKSKLKPFCLFVFALILYFISQFYVFSGDYTVSKSRFISCGIMVRTLVCFVGVKRYFV